jgi:hypothetical protein
VVLFAMILSHGHVALLFLAAVVVLPGAHCGLDQALRSSHVDPARRPIQTIGLVIGSMRAAFFSLVREKGQRWTLFPVHVRKRIASRSSGSVGVPTVLRQIIGGQMASPHACINFRVSPLRTAPLG